MHILLLQMFAAFRNENHFTSSHHIACMLLSKNRSNSMRRDKFPCFGDKWYCMYDVFTCVGWWWFSLTRLPLRFIAVIVFFIIVSRSFPSSICLMPFFKCITISTFHELRLWLKEDARTEISISPTQQRQEEHTQKKRLSSERNERVFVCGRIWSQSNNSRHRHIDDESDDDGGSVDERNRIIIIKEYFNCYEIHWNENQSIRTSVVCVYSAERPFCLLVAFLSTLTIIKM